MSKCSFITDYHAAMIVRVIKYKVELVALCKSSNRLRVGDKRYFRVSFRVMYMVLNCVKKDEKHVHDCDPTPQHLLSNFVCTGITKHKVCVKRYVKKVYLCV